MASTLRYLLALSSVFACANATVLRSRQHPNSNPDEEVGPDGHLTEPWVAAVAATLAVLLCAVAGIILFVKWRQAHRRRRGLEYNNSTLEQGSLDGRPAVRPFHGPYSFSAPNSRTPSPVSPAAAHLSEKGSWMPLPPQR
ncbi:hypothetical protein FKP32DRAFT_1567945 [Trametes sanguinea]|nr:hypothetical protein FKP32DRAFT_1567945 [Trametes sanguinea]